MKKLIIVMALAILTSGCFSANTIVKKPGIASIKKVAVISVKADRNIKSLDGGGGLTSGLSMLGALSSKPKEKEDEGSIANFAQDFANKSVDVIVRDLDRVENWTVLDPKSYMNKSVYKDFVKSVGELNEKEFATLMKVQKIGTVHAEGMPAMLVPENYKEQLNKLASELNVDAFAFVRTKLEYKAGMMSLGGNGAGTAITTAMVSVYDKTGKIRVHTGTYGYSGRSSENLILVLGNVGLTDDSKGVFLDGLGDAVTKVAMQINKETKAK
ncbi:MAG: hypothetical protein OEY36_12150 [Gammaproteobacteria bacterium]|nr:hypothetical protein [Gammaproteobacteria bacterium]